MFPGAKLYFSVRDCFTNDLAVGSMCFVLGHCLGPTLCKQHKNVLITGQAYPGQGHLDSNSSNGTSRCWGELMGSPSSLFKVNMK